MAQLEKYVVLLVVIYLQLGVCFGYDVFDYFKLSQDWIPSFCDINTCAVVPISEKFKLHGLWPQNKAGTWREIFPSYCDREVLYDPIREQYLYAELNIYWGNVKEGRRFNHAMWAYAWNKHGTCSLIWYYQLEYFKLALELFHRFDILAHLLEKGIVPANDHTYSVERIRVGIVELTTKEPDLFCKINNKGQLLLLEIRLCYTPGGQIDDCEPASLAHTCSDSQVFFPARPVPPS